jgi:hypothetical protein
MKIWKIIVAVIMVIALAGPAAAGNLALDTPESVITGLYSEYQPSNFRQLNEKQKRGLGMKYYSKDVLAKYFDENLTRLFLKDEKCKEASGEICNLDFDPALDAQDYDAESPFNLKISKISDKPLRYKATFTNIGTRSLVYELVQTKSGWRISDIIYSKDRSLRKILSRKTE